MAGALAGLTLDQAISEMFKGMGHMLSIAFILLLGFTMAVTDLAKKGMPVHPNSVRARDYLKRTLQ